MKTNYEKQATDFLRKTGCKMTITYKETRDVYDVKIERGTRKIKFEFGNSMKDSEFVAVYGETKYPIPASFREKSNRDIALYVKRNLQSAFGTVKSDHIIRPVQPSEYSVLSCLTKYDPGSFENFCKEFGYDEDGRTAERIYSAVVKEWQNVCMIWTDNEIEELREIN